MKWTAETKAAYGSMTNYLLEHRLPKSWGTPPFTPRSQIPFQDPSDYRVLINDWPYGLTPDIKHLVVWSRTTMVVDPDTGDLTHHSREIVEAFVKSFFASRLGPDSGDRIVWFKNWVALQSVRSLEHVHVLVKDVEKDVLDDWTKDQDCH
jgi:hypothetical protein